MMTNRKSLCLVLFLLLITFINFWITFMGIENGYYFDSEHLLSRYPQANSSLGNKKLLDIFRKYISLKKNKNAVDYQMADKIFETVIENRKKLSMEELQVLGIKMDELVKSSYISSNKVHSINVKGKAKRIHTDRNNHRKVMLQKLSAEQRALELVTDPLPLSAACTGKTFIIVLIISSPENEERRRNIRDSWAYAYNDDYRLLKYPKSLHKGESISANNMFKAVFVIGKAKDELLRKKVVTEALLSKDIILGDLLEDYRNLTMKTRLGLKWAYYECDSLYTLKTDDDVFVNPVMLVEWLKGISRTNLYTGWCNYDSPVVRDTDSKWYVSPQDYSGSVYPGYCLGGGYLMSTDVIGKVMNLSYGRKLFPMEDLYVGLMIDELKVAVRDERSHFDLLYVGRNSDCEFNKLFLAHRVLGNNLIRHIKRARNALMYCK